MKIVIGTDSFAPSISGVSIFAERVAGFMAEKGHEVCVFAPSATSKTYIDKKYDKFTVFRLGSIKNPFRKSHHISLRPTAAIKRELKKFGRPDLVHLQDPTSISAALLKYADGNNIPVVITNHFSLDFILSYVNFLKFLHPPIAAYLKWRFSRFYNRCVLVTTPSKTAKRQIEDWGFKTPLKVFSNGIDTQRFHPVPDKKAARDKFKLPDKPIVVYSGRIDKDKNVDVLVRAIPLVLKKVEAHFFFVGGGQMVDELKTLARELGVEKSVTFGGWLDYSSADFPSAYQASTLFASPSCIETQSIVMLEALSTGLPVVAARAGSFPEFIRDGENGYLCKPADPKDMAEKIAMVLGNQRYLAQLNEGAKKSVEEHRIDACMKRFEEVYKEIINNAK